MIRLEAIQFITSVITLTLVYAVVTTFSGWFRAWVAYLLGDDTPAELGFLSFNPLDHLDPFGALLLALIGFGWGKKSPIDIDTLSRRRFGFLRVALASYADVLALFFLAFIMLLVQFSIVGVGGLYHIVEGIVAPRSLTVNVFFVWWPELSTWSGVIGNAAMLITRLSIVLGSIYTLWRLLDIAQVALPSFGSFMRTIPFWVYFLVTFFFIVFLGTPLYLFMIRFLVSMSSLVATALF